MKKRIAVGMFEASGVTYEVRCLPQLGEADGETCLLISESGRLNIGIEHTFNVSNVLAVADYVYDHKNIAAPVLSGSCLAAGMVVPGAIKSRSGIANSENEEPFVREADVALKEKRKRCLVETDTRLPEGHLGLMSLAADTRADLLPPVSSFHHQSKTIKDLIDKTVDKVLDPFHFSPATKGMFHEGTPNNRKTDRDGCTDRCVSGQGSKSESSSHARGDCPVRL